MIARMPESRLQSAGSVGRLGSLVERYARRVAPAVLAQQRDASVSSALGVWLLLAACARAAEGSELAALEETLGCSAREASALLAAFVSAPPPALKAATAIWVRASDATEDLAAWARGLPEDVEFGFMPTASEADAWAARKTLDLIRQFPLEIDEQMRIVLASALATRVSWEVAFDVTRAADELGRSSQWAGRVSRLLWDGHPAGHAMIAGTRAAGLVAVHVAVAREDLTVVSVSAAPEVDRAAVVAAALELAVASLGDLDVMACSLYDLPLGAGHSWEITERSVMAIGGRGPRQRIAGVALPAWEARGELDLMASDAFGTAPALERLRRLIGPRPGDECAAKQTALASFGRYGFEAAAVTAFGVRASAAFPPGERVVERAAVLRFDHPYAAVAVAGRPGVGDPSGFAGLPLFTAWVHEPVEPEDAPPGR
jgi:hypothetical protein